MQIKEEQNKEFKLLKPKMDVVFQSLFNQEHEDITKSFVEALLEEKINSIVINDSKELIREKPEEKLGILDLELDINNKEKVDVEIQLIKNDEYREKLVNEGKLVIEDNITRKLKKKVNNDGKKK